MILVNYYPGKMFLNLCLLIKFYFKESTIYRSGHGLPRRRCTSSSQSTTSQCGWEPVRVFTTELLPPSPTPDGTTSMIVSLGMGSPTTAARVSVLFSFFAQFFIRMNLSYSFDDVKNNVININYGCI